MSDEDDLREFFERSSSWIETDPESNAGALPPRPPKSRRAMRRSRKRKKTKRIIAIIAAIVIVGLLGTGAVIGTRKIAHWTGLFGSSSTAIEDYDSEGEGEVQFSVAQGENPDEIARKLVDEGIVKSVAAFTSAVSANDLTLYPGTYTLKHHMKASLAAAVLSDQGNARGFVEVKPGERLNEVIDNLVSESGIAKEQFETIIHDGGKNILPAEANGHFEGWLEPGSYNVTNGVDAEQILKTMVDARIAKLDDMGAPTGEAREKLLIEASIAEAEVNSTEYYGKVVRVILNRLDKGMTLGMDTTVAYGLNTTANKLTDSQLNDSSNPYNTRVNKGLPPTPISNPGDNAIQAALNPPEGNWLYFVTTNLKTGETKFTDNDAEFQKLVEEYKTTNPDAN